MTTSVRARFSNGVLTPLEPLELEEGKEVIVSVEEARVPSVGAQAVLEMFDELHRSIPQVGYEDAPTDGAKNYKHYLYGRPKEED